MNKESIKGKLYLVGAFGFAGTSVVAARYVSGKIGAFTIAAISLFFALTLLLPLCFSRLRAAWPGLTKKNLGEICMQAFFGMFLFRFLLLNGVSRTSSLEAGILTGTTPAITAFFAWALLRERVGVRTLLGILATIAGGLLVQDIVSGGGAIRLDHLWGNLLVVGAAASESLFSILSRASVLRMGGENTPLDPLVQTTLVTAAAFLFCLIPAALEEPFARIASVGLAGWLALSWYGFFVTALAYLCWYAGIKRSEAFTAAAFSGLMPLTSMILSAVLLRERADLYQWLGGACVIAGMMLIGAKRKKISK